jgi:hypothetical protein
LLGFISLACISFLFLFDNALNSIVLVNVLLQEETVAVSKREVSMERADEKAGNGDTNREDYVHVRAKRGQATNNHSLAERVLVFLSNICNAFAVFHAYCISNAVSKGEDKRKDEASPRPRPGLQQGMEVIG